MSCFSTHCSIVSNPLSFLEGLVDTKRLSLSLIRFPCAFPATDISTHFALKITKHFFNLRLASFDQRFDSAIAAIPHPAGDSVSPRSALGGIAEANTLDRPGEENAQRAQLVLSHAEISVSINERLCEPRSYFLMLASVCFIACNAVMHTASRPAGPSSAPLSGSFTDLMTEPVSTQGAPSSPA